MKTSQACGVVASWLGLLLLPMDAKNAPQYHVSTPDSLWVSASTAPLPASGPRPGSRIVDLGTALVRQEIDGFGGCFNEKGWEVLGLLAPGEAAGLLDRLFTPGEGCAFNLGRMPMGANDYSLEWYSYDETPDDLALANFSIERDRRLLIPYLREGLRRNPDLRIWASPWCPPSWMKVNRHYAGQPAPVNDLPPERAGREMETQFRMEPAYLSAYAEYFVRFVEAYRQEGIRIDAVHVQNEPNSSQNFPSCVWRPEDLARFIGDHLGPAFQARGLEAQIWLGTIERPHLERVESILDSAAGRYVAGVGLQWAGRGLVAELHRRRPELPLMQTETECGDGSNDWAAARHTWELMQLYFRNGAKAYLYWNMVLDETGNSRWGWRQNAMITVNRADRTVRYNPEFYLMRHFGQTIRRGARYLALPAVGAETLAFRNPDGRHVVILANPSSEAQTVTLLLPAGGCEVVLPPSSLASFAE